MAVVFANPEAAVAQRFAVAGQLQGFTDGGVFRAAGDGDGLVKDGERDHGRVTIARELTSRSAGVTPGGSVPIAASPQ
jgi:hypothetical protein